MESMDAMPATEGLEHSRLRATRGDQGHSTLAGEADVTSIDALRAALEEALVDGGPVVSLDLAKLSFIDAAALSELLHYQLLALSRHQELRVESASDEVTAVFEAFDLQPVLMRPRSHASS
jgi:anti-anti-sigma factor